MQRREFIYGQCDGMSCAGESWRSSDASTFPAPRLFMTTRARRQPPTPRGAQPLPSRSTCALVPVVVAVGRVTCFQAQTCATASHKHLLRALAIALLLSTPVRNLLPHFGDHCALDPLALFNACRSPRERLFLLSYIRGIGKRSAAQTMQSSQHRAPRRSELLSDLSSRKTLRVQPPQPLIPRR